MSLTVLYTCLDENAGSVFWQHMLSALPGPMQNSINRYASAQQRQQRISGKYLLLELLKLHGLYPAYSLSDLVHHPGTKPFIAGTDFHFSISHSGRIVACAGATGLRCGMDIEEQKALRPELLQPYFDAGTWQSILTAADPVIAGYEAWVCREALLKASGKGIQEGPDAPLRQDELYETRILPIEKGYTACIAATSLPEIIPVRQIRLY